jgi:hypothetical protein
MYKFAQLQQKDHRELFSRTAREIGIQEAIIEKDFWVCWTLDVLFSSPRWRDKMIFKGGTSLSKAFHIINRFSEDIDLILDWRQLGITSDEPWEKRSNTSQDNFCKDINNKAAAYLAGEFVPSFGKVVTIEYPRVFSLDYLRPVIVLEIGPLAEWVPHDSFEITSYAAEKFPDLFTHKSARVVTILAERTFWEKATILHSVASQTGIPPRYSRHYYDLSQLTQSKIKTIALGKLDLLHEVIAFKQRFYRWCQI